MLTLNIQIQNMWTFLYTLMQIDDIFNYMWTLIVEQHYVATQQS